jgi:hypothetical protein
VKDENLVLREKETDIVRVRKEIEALHSVIPLLAENRDFVEHGMAPPPPRLKARTTGLRRGASTALTR